MARRFHRSSSRGRSIESLRWTGGNFFFGAISAGVSRLNFLTATNDPPETIMRIRGELVAWLDGVQAPGVAVDVALGCILVPEGTGTGGAMSPIADDTAPWFLYERFTLGYEEPVGDVVDVPGLSIVRIPIDVKAMRIVRPDVEAQVSIENASLSSASAVNVSFNVRVLLGST